MKTARIMLLSAILVLMGAGLGLAVDTATITINATVTASANLTVAPTTISFPDSDPDSVPVITGTQLAITAKTKTGGTHVATLTWQAADDLKDGTLFIPISAVKWTTTGAGYQGGTLVKSPTAPVTVGTWSHSGSYNGTLTPTLNNSWSYDVGNYTIASTMTLSNP